MAKKRKKPTSDRLRERLIGGYQGEVLWGRIESFQVARSYGFILEHRIGASVFFHRSKVTGFDDRHPLRVGSEVEFRLTRQSNGKIAACDIHPRRILLPAVTDSNAPGAGSATNNGSTSNCDSGQNANREAERIATELNNQMREPWFSRMRQYAVSADGTADQHLAEDFESYLQFHHTLLVWCAEIAKLHPKFAERLIAGNKEIESAIRKNRGLDAASSDRFRRLHSQTKRLAKGSGQKRKRIFVHVVSGGLPGLGK